MRVLLLAQSYPPHHEVGALRAANLAMAFQEAGHRVTVITEAVVGSMSNVPEGPGQDVRVIPLELPPAYSSRILRFFRGTGASGSIDAPDRPSTAAPPAGGRLFRDFVLAALSVPEPE